MSVRTYKKVNRLQQILSEPTLIAGHLDLIYVPRDELNILRIKKNDTFQYLLDDEPLKKKSDLERIKGLAIPPAWADVRIAPLSNAHLQAIGYDMKKRMQYRYHPIWLKVRNRTKFYKMLSFGELLPKIRKRVEQDISLPGWPKDKVTALIIKLMEETHIRVGNAQYAKRNKTYGLSTLRNRHLKIFKTKLRFEFTGKKGKKHRVTLRNKKLRRLVSQCEEIPGWELFQFYDEDGQKTSIDSGMVNDYIHEIAGEPFTAKDFRTWSGTIIFFETLLDMPKTHDEKELHKNTLKAFDKVAHELGNTRNVCRKYYVHPLLVEDYENERLFDLFKKVDAFNADGFHSPSEKAVLQRIKTYQPLKNITL
ncbi:DNA topoisomerase IB [Pareuzebyella sediminis]|uniref:DNA topoisomerase IB n=1 Tax=Pareuzebyella sediminis TaxID=2607998 RepID=UPI0011ED64F3|nr:DNA topoisomerase IB [Pareuzebyella sediminis]